MTALRTELALPFSMLMAPMSRLLEMLSRWPRNFSQGPAAEIWSVVHFPLTLVGEQRGSGQATALEAVTREAGPARDV